MSDDERQLLEDGWYWVKILEESDAITPLEFRFGHWHDSRGLVWNLSPITIGSYIPKPDVIHVEGKDGVQMSFRTDRNNNPTAFTVDIAKQAGLILGTDYVAGDPFPAPSTLVTAKLLGDPVQLTIRVIDAIGYYTKAGQARWTYIALPKFVWDSLTPQLKKQVIGFHYKNEGGVAMASLFT